MALRCPNRQPRRTFGGEERQALEVAERQPERRAGARGLQAGGRRVRRHTCLLRQRKPQPLLHRPLAGIRCAVRRVGRGSGGGGPPAATAGAACASRHAVHSASGWVRCWCGAWASKVGWRHPWGETGETAPRRKDWHPLPGRASRWERQLQALGEIWWRRCLSRLHQVKAPMHEVIAQQTVPPRRGRRQCCRSPWPALWKPRRHPESHPSDLLPSARPHHQQPIASSSTLGWHPVAIMELAAARATAPAAVGGSRAAACASHRAAWCLPPSSIAVQRRGRRAAGRRAAPAPAALAPSSGSGQNGLPSGARPMAEQQQAKLDTLERASGAAADGGGSGGSAEPPLVWTKFVAETLLPTKQGKFRLRGYRHTVRGWAAGWAEWLPSGLRVLRRAARPPPASDACRRVPGACCTPAVAERWRADLHRAVRHHRGAARGAGGCARAGARRLLHERGEWRMGTGCRCCSSEFCGVRALAALPDLQ